MSKLETVSNELLITIHTSRKSLMKRPLSNGRSELTAARLHNLDLDVFETAMKRKVCFACTCLNGQETSRTH